MNNNVNTKSSNSSKIIIAILAILLIGTLSFICYDKFINKEKPPVTPTNTTNTTDNTKDDKSSLTVLNSFELTNENQSIKIGNNTFNVRIPALHEGVLYINDQEYNYGADYVYVTDNFAFFTQLGQFNSSIEYAIDENGNAIKLEVGNYYIHDMHIENGMIVGKGMDVIEALDKEISNDIDLILKYENGVLSITPKK